MIARASASASVREESEMRHATAASDVSNAEVEGCGAELGCDEQHARVSHDCALPFEFFHSSLGAAGFWPSVLNLGRELTEVPAPDVEVGVFGQSAAVDVANGEGLDLRD